MPPARAAITAVPAGDVTLARNAVARAEAAYFAAQFDDFSRVFMADGHGHGNGFLRPGIPVVDVHVGAAYRRAMDLDEHVIVADRRLRDVLPPDAGFSTCLEECFHVFFLVNDAKIASRRRERLDDSIKLAAGMCSAHLGANSRLPTWNHRKAE